MSRIVIRPRIQIAVLLAVFGIFGLVGLSGFTSGDSVARRDWFGIILNAFLMAGGALGIWRSLRLAVVIDENGIRSRNLDRRDHVTPWSSVRSIECEQIGARAGLPLLGPVLHLEDGRSLPITVLGSYSRNDAEAKVEKLRNVQGAHR